jgi:hypothetical protein
MRKKLALTSLTSGGRSVGIVRLRTEAMEFYVVESNGHQVLRTLVPRQPELKQSSDITWIDRAL